MTGGNGRDTYVVDNTRDTVIEAAGRGVDAVHTTLLTYTLGANVENLRALSGRDFKGVGNELANALHGNSGDDALNGKDGDDRLFGMAGNDTLNGGQGVDLLIGGAGADRFVFTMDSGTDAIADFTDRQDKIVIVTGSAGPLDYDDIKIRRDGSDTRLEFGDSVVTLNDFNSTLLSASDFSIY